MTFHRLMLIGVLVIALGGVLVQSHVSAALPDIYIGSKDLAHARQALYFARKENYPQARFEANKAKDPVVLALVQWMEFRNGYNNSRFDEVQAFLLTYPNWPGEERIRNQAERSMRFGTPLSTRIDYFSRFPPQTAYGKWLYGEALLAVQGRANEGRQLLRDAWKEINFKPGDQDVFLKKYEELLQTFDYVRRVDRLLWEEKVTPAKVLLRKVDKAHRLLFEARIALMQDRPGVDAFLSAVPKDLQDDAGLNYERVSWRARRKRYMEMLGVLAAQDGVLPYPEKWWKYRHLLARELIEEKRYKEASNILEQHGLPKGSGDFAEAEWLAGWIKLRFLHDPKAAYEHFYALHQNVQYPVSIARGAYWAGRAAEANQNADIAKNWYAIAAKYPTVFYGQLAWQKLYKHSKPSIADVPVADAADVEHFRANLLVKGAYILMLNKEKDLARKFIHQAVENAFSPAERALIASFGQKQNMPMLAVEAAREALRQGTVLIHQEFPLLPGMPATELEPALTLAIIKQESRFDREARSGVGAMGLMQLMPATARRVSKQLHMSYSTARLVSSEEYNVKLGSYYLHSLLEGFDGFHPFAIASYNAGPGNVRRWIKTFGDPQSKHSVEATVDWIESIPFSETRNYVQRVLENMHTYRYLLNNSAFNAEEALK